MRTQRVNVEELLGLLLEKKLLNEDQAKSASVRSKNQKARLQFSQGLSPGRGSKADSEITAAEIIASLQMPIGGDAAANPLDEDTIVKTMGEKWGVKYEKLDPLKLNAALITQTISLPFARKRTALPLRRKGKSLEVAVSDPHDEHLFEELRMLTREEIVPVLSSRTDIQRIITEVYGFKRSVSSAAKEIAPSVDLGNLEQLFKLGSVKDIEANDKHVVNAVEYLLHYAFDQRASDIHIEPKREFSQVRMRIDGVLHDIYRIPRKVHPAVVTRIKMMSRLDLAERRRPQDGRFKTDKDGAEVEMRVSTLPVGFGEKVVIRIFDPGLLIQEMHQLGMGEDSFNTYLDFVERPNGLVLVTGPTGSGKTTTLYSTLRYLSNPEVNVTSIEDPIEIVVDDFNQVAVHKKIDLDFAKVLKHILRQDPDIIMVGEVRDGETADQSLQAALTGHLVLSTLHTNDSASTISRLMELGMDPYLVASTLVGVVAQRLVRKICENCKTETVLNKKQETLLGVDDASGKIRSLKVWKGEGCVKCRGTGLYGRTAIFEILSVNDNIRELITQKANAMEIKKMAVADGTVTLREAAIRKLAEGETSFEEVLRVTIDEDR